MVADCAEATGIFPFREEKANRRKTVFECKLAVCRAELVCGNDSRMSWKLELWDAPISFTPSRVDADNGQIPCAKHVRAMKLVVRCNPRPDQTN
jgi:hypothetical protein